MDLYDLQCLRNMNSSGSANWKYQSLQHCHRYVHHITESYYCCVPFERNSQRVVKHLLTDIFHSLHLIKDEKMWDKIMFSVRVESPFTAVSPLGTTNYLADGIKQDDVNDGSTLNDFRELPLLYTTNLLQAMTQRGSKIIYRFNTSWISFRKTKINRAKTCNRYFGVSFSLDGNRFSVTDWKFPANPRLGWT